ncbi:craniofacial development protein 2-like [Artemia franciscana]|uniref:Uncharacterized protein n=1 Tax=Artemia franciscana TaxID=6661 RepID=A0AA88IIU7_ARTSF|nr:hypothetical protein QYM36_003894 [Artemia franciscana]
MSQLSKTEQVLREMKQYNIDILALREIRWKGVGQETLDHGYVLSYSGEDNYHQAGADDDVKDSFYETLQIVTKEIPKHDVLCVVDDLNAKVGADPKYFPEVLGPHGLGQISENGALLVDFALSNDLVVGGTLFEHKNVHKYTRTSPDGSTRN